MQKLSKILLYTIVIVISLIITSLRMGIWYSERTDEDLTEYPSGDAKVMDIEYQEEINRARNHILGIIKECKAPSVSIAVSVKGKTVWSEAIGYSNLEKKEVAAPSTQYRIHSVSKLLTSALAARLHDLQKLDWDIDIHSYLPDYPDKGFSITAAHLASHRSGIRDYRDDSEAVQIKNFKSISESLEMFKEDPLVFEPDKDFLYSGFGYVLLSAVLEKAGDGNFTDLVKQHVLTPLLMTNTMEATKKSTFEATYYDHVAPYSFDGTLVISPPNDFSFKLAAGGFLSTSEDLVKFGNAHIKSLNRNFLRGHTFDRIFTPKSSQLGLIGHGLGWMTARDLHLRKVYFHFGAGSGGTSVLAIYPDQQVCISILSNLGHAKFPGNRLMGIANAFQFSLTKIIFNVWSVLFVFFIGYQWLKKIRL